jgi:TRAP-type mannitol/chloroaromatic compound transport system permease small subunit
MIATRLFDAVERAVSVLSSLVILSVMMIVSVDVFMRYALNSPLRWSYDSISLYALVAVFYFSVSRAYTLNYHLRLDILYLRFPPRVKTFVNICSLLITIPLILWIAKINGDDALRAYRLGLAQSGRYAWPLWPIKAMVCVGFGLLTVRMVLDLVKNGFVLFAKSTPSHEETP